MKATYTLAIIIATILSVSFSANAQKNLTVGFYNVENLFDTINDPTIDDEDFLPNAKNNWTGARYAIKLNKLATVIAAINNTNGPDVLGVCEIENRKVLEDLIAEKQLKGSGYTIAHFDSKDKRGIDIGLLVKSSTFQVLSATPITVAFPDEPQFTTRDILHVVLKYNKDTLHVFANHFPSRRGGELSEGKRTTVAAALRSALDKVYATNSQARIIVMGDFNDEPDNQSIKYGLHTVSTIDSAKYGALYNTMAPLKGAGKGSYVYRGTNNMLDQIMVSQGMLHTKARLTYIDNSASIFSPDFIKETDEKYKGAPFRTYAGPRYLGGYSDHFPVYIQLSTK